MGDTGPRPQSRCWQRQFQAQGLCQSFHPPKQPSLMFQGYVSPSGLCRSFPECQSISSPRSWPGGLRDSLKIPPPHVWQRTSPEPQSDPSSFSWKFKSCQKSLRPQNPKCSQGPRRPQSLDPGGTHIGRHLMMAPNGSAALISQPCSGSPPPPKSGDEAAWERWGEGLCLLPFPWACPGTPITMTLLFRGPPPARAALPPSSGAPHGSGSLPEREGHRDSWRY